MADGLVPSVRTVPDQPPPNYSSFDDICNWFDEYALDKIRESYDEEPDFLTFGVAFIAIENGEILPEISPVPVIADSDLTDEDLQTDFADQLRAILEANAATGVAMIMRVVDSEDEEDAVIVALEHKGGRAAWIALAGADGLEEFKRDDTISWKPGHAFANLMPKRSMN